MQSGPPLHRVAVLLGDCHDAEQVQEADRLRVLQAKTTGAVTFDVFNTLSELRTVLLKKQHSVVHFAGRCDGRVLWYRHDFDSASMPPQQALFEGFLHSLSSFSVRLLILSCCSTASEKVMRLLSSTELSLAVIGWETLVSTDVLVQFNQALYSALSYGVHPLSSFRHAQDELVTWAEQDEQHSAIYRQHVYCRWLPSQWSLGDEDWAFAVVAPASATHNFLRVMKAECEETQRTLDLWYVAAGQVGLLQEQREEMNALLDQPQVRTRCMIDGVRRVELGNREHILSTTEGPDSHYTYYRPAHIVISLTTDCVCCLLFVGANQTCGTSAECWRCALRSSAALLCCSPRRRSGWLSQV